MSTIGPSILAAPSSPCNSSAIWSASRGVVSGSLQPKPARSYEQTRVVREQRLHAFQVSASFPKPIPERWWASRYRAIQVHPVAVDGVEGAGRRIMRPEDVKGDRVIGAAAGHGCRKYHHDR